MSQDSENRNVGAENAGDVSGANIAKYVDKESGDKESGAKHDVFTVAKRSQIMSKVRSTGNASTELKLIAEFKERKITGWRRKSKIFGHPDFIFPKLRVAVFVDGCFWHGHDCRNTKPKDNADYWRAKIERNQRRDQAATERLTELGYRVVRIWECEFQKKRRERLEEKLAPIVEAFERWKAEAQSGEAGPN
ncbi:MAG: DNA mismatch endonuclease Vsr [Thermoguttaceae bacterium]|nr:DNA mismatch endonuclease Vsr [Thermoguttaceae bacterium]